MSATYEVMVADALLPELTSADAVLPAGWRIVEVCLQDHEDAVRKMTRVRIVDEDASSYYEGKRVTPTLQADYAPDGTVTAVRVLSREVDGG